MLIARKILFYLFLLIYCVLCPLLILYSFGYILHPVKRQISQTGLIYLDTIPPGADIYLGKSRYRYRTPASITELFPGRYQITLKLRGRRPWSHEISIEEGRAAAFKNVLLMPKRLTPHIVIPGSDYQNLILLPETDSFILGNSPQLKDFFIFNWKNDQLEFLLENDASYSDFPVSAVYSQGEGKKIIIFGGPLLNKKLYLVDLENKEDGITDITKLFNGKPDELIWNMAYEDSCFLLYGDSINRLDLKQMAVYPQFIEDIKGFGISGKWLYVLGKDSLIWKTAMNEKQRTVLFEDKNFGKNLFSKSRFYGIQVLEDEIFIFFGEAGDLITTIPPYNISQGGVSGINLRKQHRGLMYWSKNTIQIADFTGGHAKNLLFSDRIISQAVYDRGRNIAQCFWAYNGTHIIFRDRNEVSLLGLVPDGKHHIEYITKVKANSDVFYSEENDVLYYLDEQGNLMKLGIFPKDGKR